MAECIPESGMCFIADNTFRIEKSTLYSEKSRNKKINSVEFLRVKSDNLILIEAKTTFPDPNNHVEGNLEKFHSEVADIRDKFVHSLNLIASVEAGVSETEYPSDFVLPEHTSIVFMLVIKNHDLHGCRRIKATIEDALPMFLKTIWNPTVYVINLKTATKYGLTYSDIS
jgi:hypothetical protein